MRPSSSQILFVSTHTHLPERVGGLEWSTHELASALASKSWGVGVLCQGSAKKSVPTNSSLELGINEDFGYRVFRVADIFSAMCDVIKEGSYSWIIIHYDQHAVRLTEIACSAGARVAVYFRDAQLHQEAWRLTRTHPSPLFFLANSKFTADYVRMWLGISAHVIRPPINPDRYRVSLKGKNVLFVNPIAKKGIEITLSMAMRLPNIVFDIVESWPMNTEHRDYYRTRSAAMPNVVWHEIQLDMRPMYERARLLLVPSLWEEGWARVVSEAQVSGIPIVASARGGLVESVGMGGMLVYGIHDLDAWQAAIEKLFWNDVLYAEISARATERSSDIALMPSGAANALIAILAAQEA
jgi:glycosyltransferase involved in cell wall biosynthesis